jgi:hypothetical protein
MRADIRFAKARKNRPAPLGMTNLRELAKAVLDENVVATQTLKLRPPKPTFTRWVLVFRLRSSLHKMGMAMPCPYNALTKSYQRTYGTRH